MSVPQLVIGASDRVGMLMASLRSGGDDERSTECVLKGGSSGDLSTAIGELLDAMVRMEALKTPGVQILLLAPLAQVRTLRDLPPLEDTDLARLLEEHRERFFRPSAELTLVGAHWHRDTGEVWGRAALVEASLLERIEQVLEGHGVRVGHFLAAAGADEEPVELLSDSQRARLERRRTRIAVVTAGIMIASWIAPAVVYWTDLVRDDEIVRSEFARAQASLRDLESLEARLAEFEPVATAFLQQTRVDPRAVRQLVDIAIELPRETHLHSLLMTVGGETRLEVHAPMANSVPGSLEVPWAGRLRVSGEPSPSEPFTIIVEPVT